MLPGGRNLGQTAQKGPGENKVGQKNLWPNFRRILPIAEEKGPKNFAKEVPYLMVLTHFQRQRKTLRNFILN